MVMEREVQECDETVEKLLDEYEQTDRKRRMNLWFMFLGLRDEFDEIDRHDKYPPYKFGVDPCMACCGG